MVDLFEIPEPNRHWGCRVNDQLIWNGMRSLILQNELIQIVVHVDKGAEITQFLYKPLDVDFLWRAPNDLHNPAQFVSAGGSKSAPFFDHWSGGWFEVVPNNGPECTYKGADLGFYAETINIPWHYRILEDNPERVKVGLWVKTYRLPLLLRKTLTIERGEPHLSIEEQLTNLGKEPIDLAWGHHPVVGPPFLDGTCRISMPDCRVIVLDAEDGPGYRMKLHQESRWPFVEGLDGNPVDLRRVLPPEAGHMDNCYLTDFEEGWLAVTNLSKKVGFGLAWNPKVFRYVWLWQAYGGGVGFPWFGRSYQLGIEPWSSYPCAGLLAAIDNQSALQLKPGESLYSWLTAVAYASDKAVTRITKEGRVEFEP
jgi:galactose mutarotase-like enzyme